MGDWYIGDWGLGKQGVREQGSRRGKPLYVLGCGDGGGGGDGVGVELLFLMRPGCQTVDAAGHTLEGRLAPLNAGVDLGVQGAGGCLAMGGDETLGDGTACDLIVVEGLALLLEHLFGCVEELHVAPPEL